MKKISRYLFLTDKCRPGEWETTLIHVLLKYMAICEFEN